MQFKNILLASTAAIAASAIPTPQVSTDPIPEGTPFGVIAIHSGSDVQNQGLQASRSSLLVGANSQNASCDAQTNFATFYLKDTELFLYAESATPQKFFVDRSGMGQGVIQYVTGAQGVVRNGETKGWAFDDSNHLQFDGSDLQACPGSIDGAYSIWLGGVEKPAQQENCISIAARGIPSDNPIGCSYTQ